MHAWAVAAFSTLLVIAVLLMRWRILVLPIRLGFAAVSWVRLLFSLPIHWRDLMVARTVEAQVSTLRYHADIAAKAWSANTEYRAISRHILGAVVGPAYGIQLHHQVPDQLPPTDLFAAAQVAAAAEAVEKTRGKPIPANLKQEVPR